MATKQWKMPRDIDRELSPKPRKFVQRLIDGLHKYQRQNVELRESVEALEARLEKLTPQNTSIPPSTLHPHAKPIATKPKSSAGVKPNKQGAQPGPNERSVQR